MRVTRLSYRYAEAVLQSQDFKALYEHVLAVLEKAPAPLLPVKLDRGGVKKRKRKRLKGGGGDRYFFLPVDQKQLNRHLDGQFRPEDGWEYHPKVVPESETKGPKTRLAADYKNGKLQVEAQFGNMARWYTDVFKFQLSYSLGAIDVAVLIVPMQRFANLIDENVSYFERVARELPHAKMSLTLPIMVLGIEPEDYGPLEKRYVEAFASLRASLKARGQEIELVPFADRLVEEPVLEGEEGPETPSSDLDDDG